jgi:hypothetical protein
MAQPARDYSAVIPKTPVAPAQSSEHTAGEKGVPYDQSATRARQQKLHQQIARTVENHPDIAGSR